MIKIAKKVIDGWHANNASLDEKADFVLEHYSVKEIARSFIELSEKPGIPDNPVSADKIVITDEQFKAFFRKKGYNDDGTPSKRGRKPKLSE